MMMRFGNSIKPEQPRFSPLQSFANQLERAVRNVSKGRFDTVVGGACAAAVRDAQRGESLSNTQLERALATLPRDLAEEARAAFNAAIGWRRSGRTPSNKIYRLNQRDVRARLGELMRDIGADFVPLTANNLDEYVKIVVDGPKAISGNIVAMKNFSALIGASRYFLQPTSSDNRLARLTLIERAMDLAIQSGQMSSFDALRVELDDLSKKLKGDETNVYLLLKLMMNYRISRWKSDEIEAIKKRLFLLNGIDSIGMSTVDSGQARKRWYSLVRIRSKIHFSRLGQACALGVAWANMRGLIGRYDKMLAELHEIDPGLVLIEQARLNVDKTNIWARDFIAFLCLSRSDPLKLTADSSNKLFNPEEAEEISRRGLDIIASESATASLVSASLRLTLAEAILCQSTPTRFRRGVGVENYEMTRYVAHREYKILGMGQKIQRLDCLERAVRYAPPLSAGRIYP